MKLKDVVTTSISREERKEERIKGWKRPNTKVKRAEGTIERKEDWEAHK